MASLPTTSLPSFHGGNLDSLVALYYQHSVGSPRQQSLDRKSSAVAKGFYAGYKDDKGPLEELDNYTLIETIKDFCDDNNIDIESPPIQPSFISVPQKLKQRIKACIKVLFKIEGKSSKDELNWVHSYSNPHSNKDPKGLALAMQPDALNTSQSLVVTESSPKASDILSPKVHLQEYQKMGKRFEAEIRQLVNDKNVEQIRNEAKSNKCVETLSDNHYKDIMKCPCIARICVILSIYHQFEFLVNEDIRPMHIGNKLRVKGIYNDQQIEDDFEHIRKHHFQNNHEAQKSICTKIAERYPCIAGDSCCTAKRHTLKKLDESELDKLPLLEQLPALSRVTSSQSDYDGDDFDHSQRCDNIHYYFVHSQVKNGKSPNAVNLNDDDDKESTDNVKIGYLGAKEDKAWIDNIKDIEITNEQKVYDTMVKHMGGFQWQSPFGFHSHRGLTNIKPRYKNIKDEILHNKFYSISTDSWNQTIRKSKVFYSSWARRTIRTLYDGTFDDDVMHHHAEWKKNEEISLPDIVTLKLYTDFDKLQFQLKKCFRLESMDEIVEQCSRGHETLISSQSNHPISKEEMKQIKEEKMELKEDEATDKKDMFKQRKELEGITIRSDEIKALEDRLKTFYHWRGGLLIFLNKFSTLLSSTLDRKEFMLYHGINSKMMVSPNQTAAFFGPLSTSSSYHVAKTFATDKGVVLAISTQYPRLKMCRAFDASLISDYPEEQEWLIGFIYLRVMKIYTKIKDQMPFESHMRFVFFAIHLFQKQLFSMNHVLEYPLKVFIQHQLFVINKVKRNDYEEVEDLKKGAQFLQRVYDWAKDKKTRFDPKNVKVKNPVDHVIDKHLTEEKRARYDRVVYILMKKFEQFCSYPNEQQIIKLDTISSGLRKYFLKDSGKYIKLPKQKKEKLYIVSFKKILNLFPNVQEIHFLNWYKFDNITLKSFMEEIVDKKNTNIKLKQIKFLYFDYKDQIEDHLFFFHPNKLKKKYIKKLNKKNWKIISSNDHSGYRIRIKSY